MSNYDNASWGQYGTTTPSTTTQETAQSWSQYSGGRTNQSKRACTEKQIKYYLDLCKQKEVKAKKKKCKEWSFEKMSAKIGELRGLQTTNQTMTDKQRTTIEDVIKRTPEIDINALSPKWQELPIKEASELIGKLFELERSHRDNRECSDAQADKMVRMYLCPDVIFTDCGWVERFDTFDGRKMLVIPSSSDVREWVKSHISSAKANEFIRKYQSPYIQWSKSRLSPEQQHHIRTLEGRMANLYSAGKEVVQSADMDGTLQADNPTTRKTRPNEYAPIGHKPMTDLEIFQLSKESASEYIEILTATLADKEEIKFTPEQMQGDRMEEKRTGTGDSAVDNDIALMANFIHGVYAQLGEELDDFAQRLAETPSEALTDPANNNLVQQIRELIAHSITNGVSFGSIDMMMDNVPNVRVALGA